MDLRSFNTFALNGKAREIHSATSRDELVSLWQMAKSKNLPALLLGEGSNVLFVNNFDGIVILNRITGLTITQSPHEWFVHVGAGENWHQLIVELMERGIHGMENLALIPGTVGAAPIQNTGAYGVEMKDVCNYVDVVDLDRGEQHRLSAFDCKFSYRDSIFKHELRNDYAIVSVGFKLNKLWKPILTYRDLATLDVEVVTPKKLFETVCGIRRSKLPDPAKIGNAGSFFKASTVAKEFADQIKDRYPDCPEYHQIDGTVKIAAGWMIDRCNLKGSRFGGAAVHDEHAVVLVNKNNATGEDIVNLASFIHKAVLDEFGVSLEPEVRFIGTNGEMNAIEAIRRRESSSIQCTS